MSDNLKHTSSQITEEEIRKRVESYLHGRGVARELSAEIAQESFSRLIRKYGNAPDKVKARIAIGISRWVLFERYRKTQAESRAISAYAQQRQLDTGNSNPIEILIKRENKEILYRAILDELDPKERLILQLRYAKGQSFDQIAIQLGIKAATARQRSVRALDKVRAKLREKGLLHP